MARRPKANYKTRLTLLGVFLFLAAVYVGVSLCLRADVFFVQDMGVKYVQVESLLRQKFRTLALVYPAESLDPRREFFPFDFPFAFERNGRAYSAFPPAFPALCAIPYYFLGCRGLYLIPLAAGLGTLAMIPLIAGELRVRRPALVMLLAGLGTPLCFYSLLFWEHTLAAFLFAASLFFGVRALRRGRARDAAWCGVFAGLAPWFRTEMFLAAAAMAAAFLLLTLARRMGTRVICSFCAGAGLMALPIILFNTAFYGGPLGAHYLQNIRLDQSASFGSTWIGALLLKLFVLPRHLLFGRQPFCVQWQDAAVFAPFIALMVLWLAPAFRGKREARAALLLVAGAVAVYVAYSCRVVSGFFAASPAMILAFAGGNPFRLRKKGDGGRRPAVRAAPIAFCFLIMILFSLLVFATSPVLGDIQFGPRFLLPVYVPAVVLAARTWGSGGTASGRLAVAGGAALVLCSLWMGAQGMDLAYSQKAFAGDVKDTVARTKFRVVASDVRILWLTGPLYFERLILRTPDQQALTRLGPLLSKTGEEEFLFVTRSVKPVGLTGITVAAATAPKPPRTGPGDVVYLVGRRNPSDAAGEPPFILESLSETRYAK